MPFLIRPDKAHTSCNQQIKRRLDLCTMADCASPESQERKIGEKFFHTWETVLPSFPESRWIYVAYIEVDSSTTTVQWAAAPFGGSDGIPTKMSMLTGFPDLTAGLNVHWLNANFAAASISSDKP